MDDSLNGQVAIVTGAAIGIGFEIARSLSERGAAIVLNDIDRDAANAAAETIRLAGGQCEVAVGDSSDLGVINQFIETAVESFGRVDIAVANAGISPFGDFLTFSIADFQKLVTVNLQGTFFLAQRTARQMIQQGHGGRILMMSSVTGYQFHPDATAYGMTKAAIRMLVRNLGVELAPAGVRVNGLAPGATATERTLEDPAYEQTWSKLTPLGRSATTRDIAQAAMFLLSPTAEHITGQTIVIDGGWTLTSPRPD